MFKSFIPILLLTISGSLLSQDIAKLYMDHLPEKISTNPKYLQMTSKLIEKKALTHPDLIYYEIRRLNLIHGQKEIEGIQDSLNWHRQIEVRYITEKSNWAQNQMKLIQENELDKTILNLCRKELKLELSQHYQTAWSNLGSLYYARGERDRTFLSDVRRDSLIDRHPLHDDNNLKHYYVYVYYTNNDSLSYDPNIDYKMLRQRHETDVTRHISELYHKIDYNSPPKNLESIDLATKYWYLFTDSYSDGRGAQMDFDYYEFISWVFKTYYSLNAKPRFEIGLAHHFSRAVRYSESISVADFRNTANISQDYSIPQYQLSLSYRLPLKKYMSAFSYLNIQLSVASNFSKTIDSFDPDFTGRYSEGTITYTESAYFHYMDLDLKSINTLIFKVTTPVLTLTRSVVLEPGAGVGINHYAYTLKYFYGYQLTEGYWAGSLWNPYYYSHVIDSGVSGVIEKQETASDIFLNVYLDVAFAITRNVTSVLSINQNFFTLQIGYGI